MKYAFLNSLFSLLKVLLLSKWRLSTLQPEKQQKPCLIIGNAPGLIEDLEKSTRSTTDFDCVCVNYMAGTNLFPKIRPRHYVIVSTEYWANEQKEGWNKDRQEVFDIMVRDTNWKMTLHVPVIAKRNKAWTKKIAQNSNIDLCFFNLTPVEGASNISHYLFKNGLGMPRPHNVVVGSLFLMLNSGYKDIYLSGVKHDWLEQIMVTEKNRVLLGQKHFYDKEVKDKSSLLRPDPKPMYHHKGSKKERKLHEVLHKFYYTFRSYWELKEYADHLGVTIYNTTEGSYIDAFERRAL